MRKLGYLQGSYRILKKNFYELAHSNGVEQHVEQSRKPLSQQWILKKAERCIISLLRRLAVKFTQCFLLVALPYMNDMISISIHKELQSCLHLSSSLLLP